MRPNPLLFPLLWLCPALCLAQQVNNVPQAFIALRTEPQVMVIENDIEVPTEGGHLQGVQAIAKDGKQMLLITGSSQNQAYLLQVNLSTRKADKMITLMQEPYRHAGGLQVSQDYLAVGIEDNHKKTISKVCFYPLQDLLLEKTTASLIIERAGKMERMTAGATGILDTTPGHLAVVGDWNSRNWDFYQCSPAGGHAMQILSYTVPDDWPAYQAINLIADDKAIYASGFYAKEAQGAADLILVSHPGTIEPIMEMVASKTFNCKDGVDFATAAGLQVDGEGKLHIWGTQRDALKQIVVNKFSQQ